MADSKYPIALLSSRTYQEMMSRMSRKEDRVRQSVFGEASSARKPAQSPSATGRLSSLPLPTPPYSVVRVEEPMSPPGFFPPESLKHMTPAVRAFFQKSVNTLHLRGSPLFSQQALEVVAFDDYRYGEEQHVRMPPLRSRKGGRKKKGNDDKLPTASLKRISQLALPKKKNYALEDLRSERKTAEKPVSPKKSPIAPRPPNSGRSLNEEVIRHEVRMSSRGKVLKYE